MHVKSALYSYLNIFSLLYFLLNPHYNNEYMNWQIFSFYFLNSFRSTMPLQAFSFPLPETRFFKAGSFIYKFTIRGGSSYRQGSVIHSVSYSGSSLYVYSSEK